MYEFTGFECFHFMEENHAPSNTFCSSITTAGAKTIATWPIMWLGGTNPPGDEGRRDA